MQTSLLICGYSYHSEPFKDSHKKMTHYLFRLQTEGSSRVLYNDKEYPLQKGDLLLIKPGDAYDLRVEGSSDEGRVSSGDYYLFCNGSWIDDWWKRNDRPAVTRIGIDDRLLGLWRNLILEKRRAPFEENVELTDYLLRSLCLYLDRAVTESMQTDRSTFMALKLKRFIEENATVTFKLEEAARYVGLSLSRAVHLFKACYGKTMIQYAIEVRLNAALERMKYSSMTLEQIAETCGFASYSYFYRVFRAQFGISPVKFRASETEVSKPR
ncbi:helix-turn-helix domain-containing protein [Paenibacillus beijingensis]|uniref:helix-turn-helix domain-containing protein n=1 Tax=Paenibacillus beijingensis TaxID=1126833 RepID=UPI000AA8912C|nr:AraC family transcriptional regulator [Paenibacillus beijingensis]